MRHIHPFPARMAPDVALKSLEELPKGASVLDPMAGSGMVLSQASRLGLRGIGIDLDPLACLIAKVGCTKVLEEDVDHGATHLIEKAKRADVGLDCLPWLDQESKDFIHFWYDESQMLELTKLAFVMDQYKGDFDVDILDALKVSVSRLIVTKEPKASLARDTAHSRPHRTIVDNPYSVFNNLRKSVTDVYRALKPANIEINGCVILGDARNIDRVADSTIDRIVTSPPYLNAIDYMRGHKLSLVWFGHCISELRRIRSNNIGTERKASTGEAIIDAFFCSEELEQLGERKKGMIVRYAADLISLTAEASRTLKAGSDAIYVIGDSVLNGVSVRNSEILKSAASKSGLSFVGQTTRDIPEYRRYLPLSASKSGSLSKRMRQEHIIRFAKAA